MVKGDIGVRGGGGSKFSGGNGVDEALETGLIADVSDVEDARYDVGVAMGVVRGVASGVVRGVHRGVTSSPIP